MAEPKSITPKPIQVNFRAHPALVQRAAARARHNGVTLSELIRNAMIREVQDAA